MTQKYHRQTQLRLMLACALGSWALVAGAAEATLLVLSAG
jgi:hypothetical protein